MTPPSDPLFPGLIRAAASSSPMHGSDLKRRVAAQGKDTQLHKEEDMRWLKALFISMNVAAFAAGCPNVKIPDQDATCTEDDCDADIGCVETDDGTCVCPENAPCDDSRECDASEDCLEGEVCTADDQCVCPAGASCDGGEGEGEGECNDDGDCVGDDICNDAGDCVDPGGGNLVGDVEVCITFSRDHDLEVVSLESFDADVQTVQNDANGSENSARTVCGTINADDAEYIKVNVEIDGGGGTDYLAYNNDATRCSLYPTFVRVTVDGVTRSLEPLPWRCEDDPDACSSSTAPDEGEGCDAWINL